VPGPRAPYKSKATQRNGKRDAAIAAAYLSGMTMIEIAQLYGITRQRVHLIVRAAGANCDRQKNKDRT
jgi:DNA-directed RNA polymerase specialized sigma24 family protein